MCVMCVCVFLIESVNTVSILAIRTCIGETINQSVDQSINK